MKTLLILLASLTAAAQVQTPLTVNPGAGSATGEIRLRERKNQTGDNYVGIKAPQSVSTDLSWTLPATDGTLGQALVTDGAGVLSWSSVSATSFPVCNSTTGNDTYTCTVSGFTAYSAGYCIVLYADTANTGTATVNISAVGAKSILRYGGSALSNSDIVANTPVMICYDGTQFTLPPSASPGSGAFLDGGNSFGATATLGTNDNYDLAIERNNTTLITIGSSGIDMAPSGAANFYNKVRKLEITGISGETTFWDIQAAANMASSSNFKIRDNAGSRAILIDRAIGGTPINNIGLFGNVIPRKRDTVDGDAVSDGSFPDLGSSSTRWANIYGGALNMSGNGTVGGTLDVTGNLSAAVINATGSPAYRVSGTTVIDSSRNATFAGLTIATGAVNNYVWTSNGSGTGSWQATQACATCFVNGGNTFGAAATLGTNDANILNFETDNTTRWKITAAGMLQPGAADTYDIGDLSTARVRGVYAQIVDTAKSGGTGDYLRTRMLELFDNTGSSTAASKWDLNVVMSGAGAGQESYFYMRDNGGNKVFQAERIRSGGAVDRTFWFTDLLPDTTGGQTLGSSSYRWGNTYVGILDASSSNTLVPNGTASLGAGGNDWNRLWVGGVEASSFVRPQVDGGATSGSASRQWSATYTQALTASGATYLQTTGIGEASPAKGLLSVYGHNGYAYTPYNIVTSARFRTGANSAILLGTTIGNTSGWTRGLFWSYQVEDIALSRFKDDETSVPIHDLYISQGGLVGVGTTSPTEILTVGGNVDIRSSGTLKMGGTTVVDASRNATVANLTITGTCTGCGGLPVPDTDSVVRGSADGTKLLRFEVDGFTTATTRVLTPQNASYTLAGTDLAQTFTAAQTFNNTVNLNNGFSTDGNVILTSTRILSNVVSVTQSWLPTTNNTYNIGSSSFRWANVYGTSLDFSSGGSIGGNLTLNGATNTMSGTLRPGFTNTGSIGDSSYRYATAYVVNLDVSGTCTGCSGLPVTDSTAIVKGSSDATKQMRFEVDGFSTATTRTLTVQNDNYTIAGINLGQTFTATQTFSNVVNLNDGFYTGGFQVLTSTRILANIASVSQTLLPTSTNTYALGSSTYRWSTMFSTTLDVSSTGTVGGNLTLNGSTNTMSGTLRPGFDGLGSIGDATYRYGDIYAYDANFAGTITAPSGSTGWSGTRTVRAAGGASDCTLVYSGGILTGGTC